MSNRDEIEKALSYIEPHDRDVWVNTAYSLKHELGEEAFDMWDRWSQQSDSYRSRDARSVWKSIKNPTRTIASLFYDARANGYRPDTPYTPPSAEEQARRQAEAAAAREAAQRQQQENHLRVSKTAQRIWRNAAPASLAHPYLAAKGITDPAVLGGIRQSEYQGVLNLQIPIYRDGTLYNLQSISPDGGKHFLKDGLKSGGYTVVGDAADTARGIVVAEGFATAASIHQATGKPVVVAFDAGNMVTVSETLAKNLPQDIPVTIAVDNDASGTGLAKARQAAALFGDRAKAVQPEFTMTQIQQFQRENGLDGKGRPKLPSDFNDLHKLAGVAAVRQALDEGANLAPQGDGFAQAAADQMAEWQDRMQTRDSLQRPSENATPDRKGNAMAQQDTPRETPEAAQTNGIEFDGRHIETEKSKPVRGAANQDNDTPRPKQSSGVSDGLTPEQPEQPKKTEKTAREPSAPKGEPGQTDAAALLRGRDKKVVLDLNYDTPDSLKDRYITFEGRLLSPGRQYASPDNPRTVLFTDKGSKLSTAKSDLQTVKDMLEVAKQKGWDSIKIKGGKEFKSLMFVMAESQGIRTSGYSPKPEDLAMVERLRQEYALNGIENATRQERRGGHIQSRQNAGAKRAAQRCRHQRIARSRHPFGRAHAGHRAGRNPQRSRRSRRANESGRAANRLRVGQVGVHAQIGKTLQAQQTAFGLSRAQHDGRYPRPQRQRPHAGLEKLLRAYGGEDARQQAGSAQTHADSRAGAKPATAARHAGAGTRQRTRNQPVNANTRQPKASRFGLAAF